MEPYFNVLQQKAILKSQQMKISTSEFRIYSFIILFLL